MGKTETRINRDIKPDNAQDIDQHSELEIEVDLDDQNHKKLFKANFTLMPTLSIFIFVFTIPPPPT